MMKIKLLVIFLLFSYSINAQTFNKAKMDSLFSIIEANNKGMGSISIFENGNEVYQKSIGFADIKGNITASGATKYRIGSISKMFTATIIMKLIEEGKLSLDTKLSKFYPEVKNADKITIEHLLRHRSGIFNFTNSKDYLTYMYEPATKDELVKRIVSYESVFEPGEKAEYSNSNYVLLSFIAEKVSDKEYQKLLNNIIINPCGLKNTYYGSKINIKNKEAFSYNYLKDWEKSGETDMSIPSGAGAIVSNPTDLNIFLNCLFNRKIVSASTVEQMKKTEDDYGIGMFEIPFEDKAAYGHNGAIDGFLSYAFYFPEEKVSVAYVSNGTVLPVNQIMIDVLKIYFGKDNKLPVFTKALTIKSEELDKYLGIYSSSTFPLKITITKEENTLIAQATGQSSFPLEAYEKDKFRFDQAMLTLEFIPEEQKMILRQGGGEFELKRE